MPMWEESKNSFWLEKHTKPSVTAERLVQYWGVLCPLSLQENPKLSKLISHLSHKKCQFLPKGAVHQPEQEIFEILLMRFNLSMLLHWKIFCKGEVAVFSVSSTCLGTEQKYRAEGTSGENFCHTEGRKRTKTWVFYVLQSSHYPHH